MNRNTRPLFRCAARDSTSRDISSDSEDINTVVSHAEDALLYEEQLAKTKTQNGLVETFSHVLPAEEANVEHKRRIVLAVDNVLGTSSTAACEFLVDNVCREGDIVHLVHVVTFNEVQRCEPVMVLSEDDPHQVVYIADDDLMLAVVKEYTDNMMDTLGERFVVAHVPVECDVVVEKNSEAVCKVLQHKVEDLDATMLVLSTKKQSELEAFFFGSVTTYCTRHCDCPVIVLHH